MWRSTGLEFQHGPHTLKSIGWYQAMKEAITPCSKIGKIGSDTILDFCWRCEREHHLDENWIGNFSSAFSCHKEKGSECCRCVHLIVHFCALFHKNQCWFPRFGDRSPNHDWCWLLASINCQNFSRNVKRGLRYHIVILWIEFSLHSEYLFIWKDKLIRLRTWYHEIQEKLSHFFPLSFLKNCELLTQLFTLKGESIRSLLTMVVVNFVSIFIPHFWISHYLCLCLRLFPLYL